MRASTLESSLALAALLAALAGGSCVSGPSDPSIEAVLYTRYAEVGAQRDFRADPEACWTALREAVSELELQGDLEGEIDGDRGELRIGELTAQLETHSAEYTRVTVRVGEFVERDERALAGRLLQLTSYRLDT